MRILLDENIDRGLKASFDPSHEVLTVPERGWSGKSNGELLRLAEKEFDALITLDQNMRHQQRLDSFDLVFIMVESRSSRIRDVEPAMPEVNRVLDTAEKSRLYIVSE